MNPVLGIPDRKRRTPLPEFREQAQTWQLTIHYHEALKAGPHYDIRLVDPMSNIAHSWAARYLPTNPGDKTLAVRQPDHTEQYTHFEGVLAGGYGAGKVSIHHQGPVEVLHADPGNIRFNEYLGTRTSRYTLVQTGGNNWLFYNHTPTTQNHPHIPQSKPSFKSMTIAAINPLNDQEAIGAKIDGAANIIDLRGKHGVDLYSYRPSKKGSELIDHTYRLQSYKIPVPQNLANTTLMGEVYAFDPETGRALPSQDTTGALVSNVWKSRTKVPGFGIATYDVIRYKGKPFQDQPYRAKLQVLNQIAQRIPQLPTAPIAFTPEEKRRLLGQVSSKNHPLTEEGFVIYDLNKSLPTKAKFKTDYDVYIRSIHPGAGKNSLRTGRIMYSYTPDGPIIGRVGGGFSDEIRQDMYDHPNKYIGIPIRVFSMGKTPGGALRVPQFKDFRTAELFPK
jgi:hypothetical protein